MEPATYTNVKSEKFDALVEGNGSTLIALHGKTGLDTAFGQRQPHPAYPTHFTVRCYELTEGTPIPRTSQPDKMFNLAITRDLEKEDRLEMWGVQIVAPKRDAGGRRVAGTLHGRCSHTVSRANDFSHGIWKIKSGIRVNRLAREIRQELVESFSTAENRVDLDYCYVKSIELNGSYGTVPQSRDTFVIFSDTERY